MKLECFSRVRFNPSRLSKKKPPNFPRKNPAFVIVLLSAGLKTEAFTRKEITDKKLQAAGWKLGDHAQVVEEHCIKVGLPEGVSELLTPY
jgi:hypothetical protein